MTGWVKLREIFSVLWYCQAHFPGKKYSRAVLPMRVLQTGPVFCQPDPPVTLVCGPYQSDLYPSLDVSTHP